MVLVDSIGHVLSQISYPWNWLTVEAYFYHQRTPLIVDIHKLEDRPKLKIETGWYKETFGDFSFCILLSRVEIYSNSAMSPQQIN